VEVFNGFDEMRLPEDKVDCFGFFDGYAFDFHGVTPWLQLYQLPWTVALRLMA
jgi:hypothetical protein